MRSFVCRGLIFLLTANTLLPLLDLLVRLMPDPAETLVREMRDTLLVDLAQGVRARKHTRICSQRSMHHESSNALQSGLHSISLNPVMYGCMHLGEAPKLEPADVA